MKLPAPALTLAALLGCGAAPWAHADDAGLLRCRALVDAGARLACYDALALGAAQRPPTAATGAAAATPGAAAAAPSLHNEFGLQSTPAGELKFIDSHINGAFNGWNPDQQITLANGQVWRIADGSSAYYVAKDVKVKIHKKTFTNYMTIEGVNQTPNVRRVK